MPVSIPSLVVDQGVHDDLLVQQALRTIFDVNHVLSWRLQVDRLEAKVAHPSVEPVDVAGLVSEVAANLGVLDALLWGSRESTCVTADWFPSGLTVANLLENAAMYWVGVIPSTSMVGQHGRVT